MTATYINPKLPSMIRDLYRADLREKSIQNMLDLAADLVQELIDLRAEPAVTDEMVERAAEIMHMRSAGFEGRKSWADTTERIRTAWRDQARAALEAALSTERGE